MALRPAKSLASHRGHRLIVGPLVEPISVDQLRTFTRTDGTTLPTAEANDYIRQARDYIEQTSGLALIEQEWKLTLDRWPGFIEPWWDGVREMAVSQLATGTPRWVVLPRYPLSSVSGVSVFDEASFETSVNLTSVFDVDTQQIPGRMSLKFGQVWPQATRQVGAIEINYIAGYGPAQSDVPPTLQRAILQLASFLFDHRGGCDLREAFGKSGAEGLVNAYAVRRV